MIPDSNRFIGNDDAKLDNGSGTTQIVEGAPQFLVFACDGPEEGKVAFMSSLARVGGDRFNLAEHLLTITLQSNRMELPKLFPVSFSDVAGHISVVQGLTARR